ncbi:hypothetical protein HMPREF0294_0565 [Corynebacterium glucuronolyticum ATCC 51867]|nr:hypothetical protein HMPREF0294_0565 [Corynebacterium glucuronolyticum ATCC 51867]
MLIFGLIPAGAGQIHEFIVTGIYRQGSSPQVRGRCFLNRQDMEPGAILPLT